MTDRSPPPFFYFWHEDFVAGCLLGTEPLQLDEIAIYLLLLVAQWRLQGPIEDSPKVLGQVCRCDPRTVRRVVDGLVRKGKMIREAGVIYNRRMAKEIINHGKRETARRLQQLARVGGEQQQLPYLAHQGGKGKSVARGAHRLENPLAHAIHRLGQTIGARR